MRVPGSNSVRAHDINAGHDEREQKSVLDDILAVFVAEEVHGKMS